MKLRRQAWLKGETLGVDLYNANTDRYAEFGYANAKYVGCWGGEGWLMDVIAEYVEGGEDDSILLIALKYQTVGDGTVNMQESPYSQPIAMLTITEDDVFIQKLSREGEMDIIIDRAPLELNLEFRDLFNSIVPNRERDYAWDFFLLEEDS